MTLAQLEELTAALAIESVVHGLDLLGAKAAFTTDVMKAGGGATMADIAKYYDALDALTKSLETFNSSAEQTKDLAGKVLAGMMISAGLSTIDVDCQAGRRRFAVDPTLKVALPEFGSPEWEELERWLQSRHRSDLIKTKMSWTGMVELCDQLTEQGESLPPHVKTYPGFKVKTRALKGGKKIRKEEAVQDETDETPF